MSCTSHRGTAVPANLKSAEFPPAGKGRNYTSPDAGILRQPGPKLGPFEARLSDGSVVQYYWYRFVDQPSLQHEGVGAAAKAKLQALVESMHRQWTIAKEYMPANNTGTLASMDHSLIVNPPKGLEVGYVPIAVRQSR